jgi:hypothetical protein
MTGYVGTVWDLSLLTQPPPSHFALAVRSSIAREPSQLFEDTYLERL